ncbi:MULTISPECIES: FAD-dependent oxidoreductase [Rhodopseudomonas]|uniref:Amino acid dehydrogenase n=1 Tax=Rhodopseudomonas palustris TaxID=1076 RepID=A0A0D7EDH4_RHOPL|nr:MULTISPECIES: FAD-dependent oxidoreductase [Rhodopseudomonas]KIZ38879.1 amino acid dehydrogenase [Rhodopseudomonas palustris]MDF3809817.1 FAD-dependent oxidoreductase [Rhodopseudomonas sp. BAL398]WOK20117.1 FAD-dependent oxidoreductase [Rhodopseudomonas sp. BAL398]
MNQIRTDVIVLGAGIVGVSAALHLQQRGRDVVLVDRHECAGEETSFGNAGLIECASVVPYMFPRDIRHIFHYALNRSTELHYQLSGLPEFLPWLVRYFLASSPAGAMRSAMAALPLIQRSLLEHEALIAEAAVPELLRRTGWIKLFRDESSLDQNISELGFAKRFGIAAEILDQTAIAAREPNLSGEFVGALYWPTPGFVPDPGALVKAYAALFARKGGRFMVGDARGLQQDGAGWRIAVPGGAIVARDVVVALGPWSDLVFRPLGYNIPLGIKRGYHLHLAPRGNAVLHHPVLDADRGFLLAPMNRGIRLTTGAEFARRDAAPSPVQIERALPLARALFPLGEALDAKPWMGARPCLPDMLPVLGKAPRHPGLWFDFGHQHHGLTLGPATGRLLAEAITGEQPFTDLRPYAVERFG